MRTDKYKKPLRGLKNKTMGEERSPNRRFGFGLVLVLIGAVFLADNLGLIPHNMVRHLFSWQGIMIFIGTVFLLTGKNKTSGMVLIGIGGLFLFLEIFNRYWFSLGDMWPLALIVIGLVLIVRRQQQGNAPKRTPENEMDVLDDVSVFGGGEVVVSSQKFKGGKSTAIFGGSNFNLTRSKLDPGGATIDIFAMFGGTTFIVPAGWNVKVDVTAIFGGFADKRTPSEESTAENSPRLLVSGLVLFGGGEIKSY